MAQAQSRPTTSPTSASAPAVLAISPTEGMHRAIDTDHAAAAKEEFAKGLQFVLTQQLPDGGWGLDKQHSHAGLTAMVLTVLVRSGQGVQSPVVSKGFESLMSHRKPDGGFYDEQEGNQNYNTSLAAMALAAAKAPAYQDALAGAVKYLRGEQIVPGAKTPDGKNVEDNNPWVGGVSYGRHGRPDLSNVGMWMEAMHEAGVSGEDPAMQRALGFVQRLQNRSEGAENQSFVLKGEEDGGFVYAIVYKDGKYVGESYAGDTDRGLRSYGSMTYTGFKSMLYANVSKADPRVKAAREWIARYWRLDSNPNMPEKQSLQGLYYYYQVFGKAMRAWGEETIADSKGARHNWRQELIDAMKTRQTADGSWTNDADRWMEGNPVLVTAYCLMALQDATAP